MSCAICHRELVNGERFLCLDCLMHLPRIHGDAEQNHLWGKLCGQIPFQHATSFCYYQKGDGLAGLIASAKYGHKPWINTQLTRIFLQELEGSAWPYDIDLIVPVPVHWVRLLMRGYNQVSPIVRSLSEFWHLPVVNNCLYRNHYVHSQVGSTREERIVAESGSFSVRNAHRLEGRHILLVDDVCTTGSTIVACADVLLRIPGVRVSFLTLAVTI